MVKPRFALAQDPPRRLRFALARFDLAHRAVLDLGCGPGLYLSYFGPGSVGLDLHAETARAKGLDARPWNFMDGIPEDLQGQFDAVWCSALLEHALSPHQLLIESRAALRSEGTLLVVAPQSHGLPRLAPIRPLRAYLAVDHVNFFTATTLKLTIERAGYRVNCLANPSLSWLPGAKLVGPNLLAAAVPIPGFQYHPKADKRLVDGRIEVKA
jgi:SAM-dependent methyltransferase